MKEEDVKKLKEELKFNIPEDYVRSCDTSDGVGYYEQDEDSYQYKCYKYITQLENNLKELKNYIDTRFKAIRFDYENNIIDKFELVVRENELLKLKQRIKVLEGNNE